MASASPCDTSRGNTLEIKMNAKLLRIITTGKPFLMQNLDIDEFFLDPFVERDLLTKKLFHAIWQAPTTTGENVHVFCMFLSQLGDDAVWVLLKALEDTEQKYIAKELRRILEEDYRPMDYWPSADLENPASIEEFNGVILQNMDFLKEHLQVSFLFMSYMESEDMISMDDANGIMKNHSTNEKRTEMLFAKLNTSLRPSVFFRALYGTRQTVVAETIRNNWSDNNYNCSNVIDAFAYREEDCPLPQLLCEKFEDKEVDDRGNFAIHYAAIFGFPRAVQCLLDLGVDVNMRNGDRKIALTIASGYGHSKLLSVLLKRGASVDLADDRGWTPLAKASRNGHREIVKMLLDFGADPGHKCTHGAEALAISCRGGHIEIANLLIEKSANVNASARAGITALHHAAHYGYRDLVQLLLDKGAEIDAVANNDVTALLYASRSGRNEVVSLLIDRDCNINATRRDNRETALHHCAYNGDAKIVRQLLDRGAKVNYQTTAGNTSLFNAAREGHLEIIKVLLDAGADVNIINEKGYMALSVAIFMGHHDVVETILGLPEERVDINVCGRQGNTVLHAAAGCGQLWLVKELVQRGADINVKNEKSYTPLHSAASCIGGNNPVGMFFAEGTSYGEHPQVIEFLLAKGAKINAHSHTGETALHTAARWGHLGVVKKLVENGADVHAKNRKGYTALHSATDRFQSSNLMGMSFAKRTSNGKHLQVIEFLLHKGAEINARSYSGVTPLHCAARSGHYVAVKALVEWGADINATVNSTGYTPLHHAVSKNITR